MFSKELTQHMPLFVIKPNSNSQFFLQFVAIDLNFLQFLYISFSSDSIQSSRFSNWYSFVMVLLKVVAEQFHDISYSPRVLSILHWLVNFIFLW